jgi:hypothetical protein
LNDYSYDIKNSLTTNAGNHPYPYLASLIGIIITNYIITLIIITIIPKAIVIIVGFIIVIVTQGGSVPS